MSAPVSLPLWLLLVIFFFAAFGFWRMVVVPLLSGFFYRRRQRSLRKLDEQLEFGLPDYAAARREEWLDRLLRDEEVAATIESVAANGGESLEDVRSRARRDAEEILPFFNAALYFRLGYWVARWLLRLMYRIHAEFADREALSDIGRDSCVVVVSNHRSNFDPFLLIYLGSRRTAISYSAGEWARTWPIRHLLHAIGFYIVRRGGDSDPLYRKLVERYVYLAASHCVPQGLFLEGELSRDGTMQPLKLGLLNYLLKARGQHRCQDIVFVPVGLGYDRVPEDNTLVAHQGQGFRGKSGLYPLVSLARFIILIMPRMVGLAKPYGKVVANYGRPLSLDGWLQKNGLDLEEGSSQQRRQTIDLLGEELAASIGKLIPVLPVALLAQVLLAAGEAGIPELQLKRDALALAEQLRRDGVTVVLDENDEERSFSEGLYLLMKRQMVVLGGDGRLRIPPAFRQILIYYRNSIPAELARENT